MSAARRKKRRKASGQTHTYYPGKTFDIDLDTFVALFVLKGWIFSGVDGAQLQKDATDQHTERTAHDAAEIQFASTHEAFGVAQERRHQHFRAALEAARGAFARDKVTMKELKAFTRLYKRQAKAAALVPGAPPVVPPAAVP